MTLKEIIKRRDENSKDAKRQVAGVSAMDVDYFPPDKRRKKPFIIRVHNVFVTPNE